MSSTTTSRFSSVDTFRASQRLPLFSTHRHTTNQTHQGHSFGPRLRLARPQVGGLLVKPVLIVLGHVEEVGCGLFLVDVDRPKVFGNNLQHVRSVNSAMTNTGKMKKERRKTRKKPILDGSCS